MTKREIIADGVEIYLGECPQCGEVKRWLYDAQICASCGHGDRFWNKRNKENANERRCLSECNDVRPQHKRPDVAEV